MSRPTLGFSATTRMVIGRRALETATNGCPDGQIARPGQRRKRGFIHDLAGFGIRRFEGKDDHVLLRQVSVVLGEDAQDITAVVESLRSSGRKSRTWSTRSGSDDEKKRMAATLDVKFADTIAVPQLIEAVEAANGVRRVVVRHHV
jgi:hypothetical protein